MKEIEVGKVEDFFSKIGVVAIKVTNEGIKVGDTLHFHGHTTDFTHKVASMQVEHEQVQEAGLGDCIGLKVVDKVHEGDAVYVV